MPDQDLVAAVTHSDERGTLIATEFAGVPFSVQRVFTVRGPEGGCVRGNHTVSGAQLLVLLSGAVSVQSGADLTQLETTELTEPGSSVLLADGRYIRYTLPDANATIMVLCERPFIPRN